MPEVVDAIAVGAAVVCGANTPCASCINNGDYNCHPTGKKNRALCKGEKDGEKEWRKKNRRKEYDKG